MKVRQYSEEWTSRHPRPTRETDVHNRQMVADFVERHGGRELGRVDVSLASDYARLKPGAVRYVRAMLNDAKRDGLIESNPFADVTAVNGNGSRRKIEVPTFEHVQALLEACRSVQWLFAPIEFSAFVGLRIGELCALQLEDVGHLEDRGCVVDKQMTRDGRIKRLTKGKEGKREAHVPSRGRHALEVAIGNRRALFTDSAVFRDEDGSELDYWKIRRGWNEVRRLADVPIEWMQLRTFCASWLIDNGASPLDVALNLHGHTDPRVVLQYYALVDKARARERLRAVAP